MFFVQWFGKALAKPVAPSRVLVRRVLRSSLLATVSSLIGRSGFGELTFQVSGNVIGLSLDRYGNENSHSFNTNDFGNFARFGSYVVARLKSHRRYESDWAVARKS